MSTDALVLHIFRHSHVRNIGHSAGQLESPRAMKHPNQGLKVDAPATTRRYCATGSSSLKSLGWIGLQALRRPLASNSGMKENSV